MLTGLFVAPTAAAGGGGCHNPEVTDGEGDTVEMRMNCFTPTRLRVRPGATVTFVNRDEVLHALSGINLGGYDELEPGRSVQRRFDAAGVYPYMCHLHPGMTGAVIVGAEAAPGRVESAGVSGATTTGVGVGAALAGFAAAFVLRRKRRVAEA
jgi:plastocyanin